MSDGSYEEDKVDKTNEHTENGDEQTDVLLAKAALLLKMGLDDSEKERCK